MNWNDFKALVKEAQTKHPIWFQLTQDIAPDSKLILSVEREIGASLPEEYKIFTSEYGGGYFAFTNIYSLDANSDWNILSLNREKNTSISNYLVFSEDGFGNYFGFKIRDNRCSTEIYFFNHEERSWHLTEYENIFAYIAKSALST